jgi:hypothetical protein
MELRSRILMGLGAALEASTDAGRRPGGWTRLARVLSLSDAKGEGEQLPSYVVAIREVGTAREYQLGCSCPDWIHRKSHTGTPCKHQALFLAHQGATDPRGLWLYRAGKAFLGRVQGK